MNRKICKCLSAIMLTIAIAACEMNSESSSGGNNCAAIDRLVLCELLVISELSQTVDGKVLLQGLTRQRSGPRFEENMRYALPSASLADLLHLEANLANAIENRWGDRSLILYGDQFDCIKVADVSIDKKAKTITISIHYQF